MKTQKKNIITAFFAITAFVILTGTLIICRQCRTAPKNTVCTAKNSTSTTEHKASYKTNTLPVNTNNSIAISQHQTSLQDGQNQHGRNNTTISNQTGGGHARATDFNLNSISKINTNTLTQAEKRALVSKLSREAIRASLKEARDVEIKINHIIADTKYPYLKQLNAIDVSNCPEEFVKTYEQFIEQFTIDETSAGYLLTTLNELSQQEPDIAARNAMETVIQSINQITREQNQKITENITAFKEQYVKDRIPKLNTAIPNRECLDLLKNSGASPEFIAAYNSYIQAINEGNFDAIAKSASEMSFAGQNNIPPLPSDQISDKFETFLNDLVENKYQLNAIYGETVDSPTSSEEQSAAIQEILQTKHATDLKDYWDTERRIPDHEYSDLLSTESKAYLDSCPSDFREAYAQHLAAWEKMDYSQAMNTWMQVRALSDKYKLQGPYAEEWNINTQEAPPAEVTKEQRLAMEKVMEIDHDLTNLRNSEICNRAIQKELSDISNVSLSNCPAPFSDAYKEYIASHIYNAENIPIENVTREQYNAYQSYNSTNLPNTSASPTNQASIVLYTDNKVEAVSSAYLNATNTPAQTP